MERKSVMEHVYTVEPAYGKIVSFQVFNGRLFFATERCIFEVRCTDNEKETPFIVPVQ